MRFVFISLFLSFFALLANAQGTAGVSIPAGQTFILGEYRTEGYKATMTNKSNREVLVQLINQADGSVASTLTLEGGGRESVRVEDGQHVQLVNNNRSRAKVMVKSKVDGAEGMRYVDNDAPTRPTKIELPEPTTRSAPTPYPSPEAEATAGETNTTAILQPGQRLIVGEGDSGNFNVTLINRGASLEVSGRKKKGGRKTQGFGLGRFGKVDMHLRAGEVLYIVNKTGKRSTVKVKTDRPVVGARVL